MNENAKEQPGAEPIEKLLCQAAEWTPDRPAPVGLARHALVDGRARHAFRLNPAFGVAALACACVLIALPRHAGPADPPAGGQPAFGPTRPHVAVNTAPAGLRPKAGTQILARVSPTATHTGVRKIGSINGGRAQLASAKRAPRVSWSVEHVEQTRAGVLTPAWATREDESTGTLVAAPVLLDTTNDGRLADGGGTIRIIPASYNEVIR